MQEAVGVGGACQSLVFGIIGTLWGGWPGNGKFRRQGRAENPHRGHGWPEHQGGFGAAGRDSTRRNPEGECLRGRATCQGTCVAGGGHGRAHQALHREGGPVQQPPPLAGPGGGRALAGRVSRTSLPLRRHRRPNS